MIQDYARNFPKTQAFLTESEEARKLWTKKIQLRMALAMTDLHVCFATKRFDKYLRTGVVMDNKMIDSFANNYAKNYQHKVENIYMITGTYDNETMDRIMKKFTPEFFVETAIKQHAN